MRWPPGRSTTAGRTVPASERGVLLGYPQRDIAGVFLTEGGVLTDDLIETWKRWPLRDPGHLPGGGAGVVAARVPLPDSTRRLPAMAGSSAMSSSGTDCCDAFFTGTPSSTS
jgi:hypothetical protein